MIKALTQRCPGVGAQSIGIIIKEALAEKKK